MKAAVIIPAYNEEQAISKVIQDIPNNIVSEIVVINNSSTDSTAEAAARSGATVLEERTKGYGSSCLKGIEYAASRGYEVLIFLDGDYSDYPEEAELLLRPIELGSYDFVLGSRVIGNYEKGSLPIRSRIGSFIAGLLINIFWGFKYTDLGPFRAIKTEKLLELKMEDKWFGWTVEMQIKALKKKLNVLEVPVSYRKRIGKSKVTGTLKGSLMAGIIILKVIFSELFKD
ncbi:MAG TPA: glycosyltransferase family 2 protein [Ignavibacteriaceae bacterium]|nr:glycosyltransferase family 2 protein [Ignavibacteriaceae bacterium]